MEPDDEIPNWRQLLFLAWKNRDRVLAFCQVTVGAVQTAGGVVPEYHMKYWLLASGLLNVWIAMTKNGSTEAP